MGNQAESRSKVRRNRRLTSRSLWHGRQVIGNLINTQHSQGVIPCSLPNWQPNSCPIALTPWHYASLLLGSSRAVLEGQTYLLAASLHCLHPQCTYCSITQYLSALCVQIDLLWQLSLSYCAPWTLISLPAGNILQEIGCSKILPKGMKWGCEYNLFTIYEFEKWA